MTSDRPIMLITGTRKGIGRSLAEHYSANGYHVVGCSRGPADYEMDNYEHALVDVSNESEVKAIFKSVRKQHGRIDVLLNNAGIASMNHALLTPMSTVDKILKTNVAGTFLLCRESAKLMQKRHFGRIVNFTTVAVPLKLDGEAIYAASKAAVVSLTEVLAKEFAEFGITVNAVGPTPVKTDLIGGVRKEKLAQLISRQTVQRYGKVRDIVNVIDFFIRQESDFVTGQVVYLGGVR